MISDNVNYNKKKELGSIGEIIRELLRIRNIKNKDDFFNPKIDSLTIKNSGIDKKELDNSVKRVNRAIKNNETIIIFGDYDVDGICASAIIWETIYSKYKNVFPYIPDRFSEGYGISKGGINGLLKKYPDAKLIITVDNGIVANDAVSYARKKNLDIIITDHHVKSKKSPKAFSIIHTTSLCGAGISWMMARELGFESERKINSKLELAALATVADLVPLTNLNRVIVRMGINLLRKTKRIGLLELYKVAGIRADEIDTYHIGYMIAPRLNASGRITHAIDSLRLLCSSDKDFVGSAARLLDETNRRRQQMVITATQHAKLSVVAEKTLGKIIVVHHKSYSEGIIGLIASRLVEEYYRPVIAISSEKEISKGSARSVAGVDIITFIRESSTHLVNAGGHPMAAGFSLEKTKIEIFKKEIIKRAKKSISDENLTRKVIVDAVILLSLASKGLYEEIEKFKPFGMGNKRPVFLSKNVLIRNARRLGKDGSHLRLDLECDGKVFQAIGFGMGEKFEHGKSNTADIIYSLDENVWNGKRNLQLKLKDIEIYSEV